MSAQAEAYGSFAAQTRRFACDRCHVQKLRCERAPILADGNLVMLPLGICKRCEKAGVDCRTTTSSTGVGKSSGSDRMVKRKSPPIEMDDTDSDPSTHSTSYRSTIENDLATFHHSSFSNSPGDSLMFNIDGSGILDLGALETEVNEFHALEAMAAPTASTHFQFPDNTICQPRPGERGSGESMDLAYDASASSTPGSSNRSSRSGGVCVTAPVAHSQDDEQDERRRLLDLHSLIFDGLHRITDRELANFLFASDNNMTPASRNGDPSPSDIVGRVLVASERLIALLEIFGEKVPAGPTCNGPFEKFYSLPDSLADNRSAEREKMIVSPTAPSRTVALPVVLSFLACYVGLLSVYRTIFSGIQEMLLGADGRPSSPPGRSGPQLKRMCPSQAEGVPLNHGQMLRIRIQLEVMTHMLDRIRWAWTGFGSDRVRNENDAESKVTVTALLQGMLMHEGFDCSGEEFDIGLGSLQATLENIRLMLRGKKFPR
ncbi:hypothetical protein F5Y14DRAFT_409608 [Nemania sp. NC0429]|nr:hypothetical protein F5Y14DRAFT_409608 [Nemania sp. NC0429]